ncbi:MAG: NAD(P)H-dependent oxidoreductase [Myxococcales bacterium]|nr:NAD(P)H-dependent oxidoreductase [Myxococcales bacterium]
MDDQHALKILGLSGSLRRASFNTALVRAAAELAPAGVTIELGSFDLVPHYNGDLDTDALRPAAAEAFKQAIAAADAVLIATPEYNYGVPGALKNAIDWASRPAYRSPFAGKPVALLSASMSVAGGARGQGQLKQVLLGMASQVFAYPEFLVPQAQTKFEHGRLTDAATREHLERLLAAFAAWVRKVA